MFIDGTAADLPILLASLRPEIEPIQLDAAKPAPRRMARADWAADSAATGHALGEGGGLRLWNCSSVADEALVARLPQDGAG